MSLCRTWWPPDFQLQRQYFSYHMFVVILVPICCSGKESMTNAHQVVLYTKRSSVHTPTQQANALQCRWLHLDGCWRQQSDGHWRYWIAFDRLICNSIDSEEWQHVKSWWVQGRVGSEVERNRSQAWFQNWKEEGPFSKSDLVSCSVDVAADVV